MTSARKLAANRANGQKSRGPKTPAGKQRASRNALQHKLFAVAHRSPALFEHIEQLAKAICGKDENPLLFRQAVVIAENDLILRSIGTERVALIERLRNPFATPPAKRAADLPMARLRVRQMDLAYKEFSQLTAELGSQGQEMFTSLTPEKCNPRKKTYKYEALKDRDEFQAMHEAMPNLVRLQRYERRAFSRRNTAIRMFTAIKLTSQ